MIPSTLFGLVAFAASLGPGYIYVRVAEMRAPRHERTQLLEAAELLVIGAVASGISALVVLTLTDATGFIDASRFATARSVYVAAHPARALGSILLGLALSYGGAYCGARWRHRGKEATFDPSGMWHQVLRLRNDENPAYATVETRDRRLISGWVYAYTVLPSEPGTAEIALHYPIRVKPSPRAAEVVLDDQFIVLRGDELLYTSIYYPRLAVPG